MLSIQGISSEHLLLQEKFALAVKDHLDRVQTILFKATVESWAKNYDHEEPPWFNVEGCFQKIDGLCARVGVVEDGPWRAGYEYQLEPTRAQLWYWFDGPTVLGEIKFTGAIDERAIFEMIRDAMEGPIAEECRPSPEEIEAYLKDKP